MRSNCVITLCIMTAACALRLGAVDAGRDFSGQWVLDAAASDYQALGQVETSLTVSESGTAMLVSSGGLAWSYALDGSEAKSRVGDETWNSAAKWEGAALLINTLVSGPSAYTVMDRWEVDPGRVTLTIARQIQLGTRQVEGKLIFRREGSPMAPAATVPAGAPAALARRADAAVPGDLTVIKGTHVLLKLISEISTKHAKDGDKVYLRTAVPVSANGRVVIPRDSDVAGTITHAKKAGKVQGKGELFIRFDLLTLPNGTTRDFHARPPGEEGKVEANGKSADAKTVMEGAGMGAMVGAVAHGLSGMGVGGAAGALVGVLVSRNQDIILHEGAQLEMVLDRDLTFRPEELRPAR
jgi:type IV secretion system protein VirB10